MKKYLLIWRAVSLFGMEGQETKELPHLTARESLVGYVKKESYKGLSWGSLAFGFFAVANFMCSKKYPSYNLKNYKVFSRLAIGSLFLAPQILNFKTYQKLATTEDLNYFKIKDNGKNTKEKTNYTKYYFSPNPLKILTKRIMKLNQKDNNEAIYNSIIENLSVPNFIELISYIQDESADLATKIYHTVNDSLTLLIKQIDNNDKETWKKILNLLKIDNKNYKTNIKKINEIILNFDKSKKEELISEFIKIAKEKEKEKEQETKTTKIIIEEIDFERELYIVLNDIDPELGKSFTEILFTQGLDEITLPENYLLRRIDETCLIYNVHLLSKKLLLLSLLNQSSHEEQVKEFKTKLETLSAPYKETFNTRSLSFTPLAVLKLNLGSYLHKLRKTLWDMKRFEDLFYLDMHAGLEIFDYDAKIFLENCLKCLSMIHKETNEEADSLFNKHKSNLQRHIKEYNLNKSSLASKMGSLQETYDNYLSQLFNNYEDQDK